MPSFQSTLSNSSTGSPWPLALFVSRQPTQSAYLPCANQSVICRLSRPNVGVKIHELEPTAEPGARRLLRNVFTFPLGRNQIPIGFEFLRIHETGIVIKAGR